MEVHKLNKYQAPSLHDGTSTTAAIVKTEINCPRASPIPLNSNEQADVDVAYGSRKNSIAPRHGSSVGYFSPQSPHRRPGLGLRGRFLDVGGGSSVGACTFGILVGCHRVYQGVHGMNCIDATDLFFGLMAGLHGFLGRGDSEAATTWQLFWYLATG